MHGIRLCILLCSTVVLIEVSSFKLCTDVIDRAVCVCAILKGLLCCTLPGHFQVSALYRSLFLSKPCLVMNFYSVGVMHVELKRDKLIF